MNFESQCLAALKLAKDAPTYPLPSVRHLTYKDYASVYEPSDDTFLLIDAIYHDVPLSLRTSTRGLGEPVVTVELGSGSGVNVVAIAKATRGEGGREGGGKFYATDINEVAARTTEKTIEENGPWGEDEGEVWSKGSEGG
jgi:release factor glutamine methyltransferase